ncbi:MULTISPECIES: D-alanyl-D-alanine carboxypeptidase family protein [unclassified Iodidimonas]|uniref:D-alanyl-D-alanine carboxypeptidase family protein n=1 Tax=unclassified Iodidimonas TaxID=2626145 RepID=UPI0024822CBA|nr:MULTISPECIES: D-alanyl-D-alanine carboxypeptidase family protein [unclassified Iodidimonas]
MAPLLVVAPLAAVAQGLETSARHALLLEMETGDVLFSKDPETPFPPASMSKMMTVYLAFDQIRAGSLSLEDTTRVSDEAWRRWAGTEASLMFLGAGEEVSVKQLLHGIIVSSGNDACTVLAEMMSGTEDAFALWMNEKAAEIGMTNSQFKNASGWPADGQYTTAHDLATLAEKTIRDFPELYEIYAEKSYTYGKDFRTGEAITQSNRNPLIYRMDGADGLKTGHTEASGYGLTGSAIRNGRRLIVVVSGLDSVSARARESQSLLEYGFRAFDTYSVFDAGEQIGEADVWLGKSGKLPLIVQDPLKLTLSRRDRMALKMVLRYDNPIPSPIKKGQPVATVTLSAPDLGERQIPVLAGESIEPVSGFGRIGAALDYLLFGSAGK